MNHSNATLGIRPIILYVLVAVFAIFIGSQITEGVLLVPYWKSLSAAEFYNYYQQQGPSIGLFYTVVTIIAALIPLSLTIYCNRVQSDAVKPALISTCFALLFIAVFYIYFKSTNQLFYQAALSEMELQRELVTWSYWHWGRGCVEVLSLVFLIIAVVRVEKE